MQTSPAFAENYISLPLGGVDDMAIWSGRLWQRFEEWVQQGPPPNVTVGATHRHPRHGMRPLKRLFRSLAPALLARGAASVSRDAATGVLSIELGTNGSGKKLTLEEQRAVVKSVLLEALTARSIAPAEDVAGLIARERRAWRARAGADHGHEHSHGRGRAVSWTEPHPLDTDPLVIGARVTRVWHAAGLSGYVDAWRSRIVAARVASGEPAENVAVTDRDVVLAALLAADAPRKPSALHVLGSNTTIGAPTAILASVTALEYAGASLAVGDFDADGTDDVVITAYGHTVAGVVEPAPTTVSGASSGALRLSNTLPQAGAFYVRYGNDSGGVPSGPVVPQPLPPYLTSASGVPYQRLGFSSCVLDFNAGMLC